MGGTLIAFVGRHIRLKGPHLRAFCLFLRRIMADLWRSRVHDRNLRSDRLDLALSTDDGKRQRTAALQNAAAPIVASRNGGAFGLRQPSAAFPHEDQDIYVCIYRFTAIRRKAAIRRNLSCALAVDPESEIIGIRGILQGAPAGRKKRRLPPPHEVATPLIPHHGVVTVAVFE